MITADAFELVETELRKAMADHGSMKSPHEGWAVILEEVEELWDEIKLRKPDEHRMQKEAVQVAAMGIRFLIDLFDKPLRVNDGD